MTDLTNVLGGPWSPIEKRLDPPELQLMQSIDDAGLTAPENISIDGAIHRFNVDHKKDKSGWYVAYPGDYPAGRFGCWRTGVEQIWRADIGRQLTTIEQMQQTKIIAESKKLRDAELAKKHETTADIVQQIWDLGAMASDNHPYLIKKGIKPHVAKITGDGRLMIPVYDCDYNLSSLQYIDTSGDKKFHPGGSTKDCFLVIGEHKENQVIYICEGFATGASIYEAVNEQTIICFSASNLAGAGKIIREKYGINQQIVIVADNDKSGVGQAAAKAASVAIGARLVIPPDIGDANDYAQSGRDLAALLRPAKTDWLISADDFCAQPAPIKWLIKNWLQADALIMIHGPSGSGKTFLVLDWCLHLSAGFERWGTHSAKPCNIVYLAGEGHHGLRGRVAAWKQHHSASQLKIWLSSSGCDLNTPTGYLQAADAIRQLPSLPGLIVIDTLHRFLAGDENSSMDAKTMLDACSGLIREFNCAVMLVHHTGVSDDAQHRARGSSSWRGALDIEISVTPGGETVPHEVRQVKSKDSELAQSIYFDLHRVEINGWIDDDLQPVTSAIIQIADAPIDTKKESKIEQHRKLFESAWFASGAETLNDRPFLTRSAMVEYLINNLGLSNSTAKTYAKAGKPGRPIHELLIANIIKSEGAGWIICDEFTADLMIGLRNAN